MLFGIISCQVSLHGCNPETLACIIADCCTFDFGSRCVRSRWWANYAEGGGKNTSRENFGTNTVFRSGGVLKQMSKYTKVRRGMSSKISQMRSWRVAAQSLQLLNALAYLGSLVIQGQVHTKNLYYWQSSRSSSVSYCIYWLILVRAIIKSNDFGDHHVDSKGETTKKYSADPCQPDNIMGLDSWSFETSKFLQEGKKWS